MKTPDTTAVHTSIITEVLVTQPCLLAIRGALDGQPLRLYLEFSLEPSNTLFHTDRLSSGTFQHLSASQHQGGCTRGESSV